MAIEFSDSISVAKSLARMGCGGGLATTTGAGGGGSKSGRRKARPQFVAMLVPKAAVAGVGTGDPFLAFPGSCLARPTLRVGAPPVGASKSILDTGVIPQY